MSDDAVDFKGRPTVRFLLEYSLYGDDLLSGI